MRRNTFVSGFAASLVMVSLLASCASNSRDSLLERATGTGTVKSRSVSLPSQLLGLAVSQEKLTKEILEVDRPYVDSVGIFSLRENDLLRATLQVGHLNTIAQPRSKSFQDSVINLMGSTTPTELNIGGIAVYNTAGNKQSLFVWFKGRGFYVLSVHEDYEFPRTLLRRVLELEQTL